MQEAKNKRICVCVCNTANERWIAASKTTSESRRKWQRIINKYLAVHLKTDIVQMVSRRKFQHRPRQTFSQNDQIQRGGTLNKFLYRKVTHKGVRTAILAYALPLGLVPNISHNNMKKKKKKKS